MSFLAASLNLFYLSGEITASEMGTVDDEYHNLYKSINCNTINIMLGYFYIYNKPVSYTPLKHKQQFHTTLGR